MNVAEVSCQKFVFDAQAPRRRVLNERVMANLREFAKVAGERAVGERAFSTDEFDAWGGRLMTSASIAKRFGTWRKALKSAGIEGGRCARWTAAELMEILEAVWRRVGQRPSAWEVRRWGGVSRPSYARRWGSVKKACEKLAAYHAGKITRAELLASGALRRRVRLSPGRRWAVLKRDGRRCVVCGRAAGKRVRLEVDHIVPVSKGGGDEMGNLRTLCGECNRGKSDGLG